MKMEPKEASEEDGFHKGPKRVKVLSTTKSFIYDQTEEKMMFHATVATETEFFRVMVFDVTLQEMFAKKNPIVLTDYFCSNGTLMIHKASSVSVATDTSKMSISDTLKKNTKANPKIHDLHLQTREVLVYGDFKICRNTKQIIGHIFDNIDKMGQLLEKQKLLKLTERETDLLNNLIKELNQQLLTILKKMAER
ncbi:interferon-activable protein 202-like [Peromyscus eremicus]|uniref:interferon-activable protein 202-like n=1 Tax=Peromyscus eremicus TaxID=42410 RepID=UPI0027DB062B|nr:interferon-activable protein 202-like [Peromyscus eremicus]